MSKKNTATEPDQPTETQAGPKTLSIELPGDTSTKLRKLAAKTGITQARLRAELSRSPKVEAAITEALLQIYTTWKAELGDDVFGPVGKGEPDANG